MNRLEDLKPYLPKDLQNEQALFNATMDQVNNKGFVITKLDNLAAWAQSGGTQYTDWYKNLSGYRDASKFYVKP